MPAGPVPVTNALFGRGSGPVHMTSVMCRGDEGELADCGYIKLELEANNCHHARDAGVICASKNMISRKITYRTYKSYTYDNRWITKILLYPNQC